MCERTHIFNNVLINYCKLSTLMSFWMAVALETFLKSIPEAMDGDGLQIS